jgi:hypothetical protein
MHFVQPFIENLVLLRQNRQVLIDYNLRRENNRRRNFDYIQGQEVLEIVPDPKKQGIRTRVPF